MLRFTQFGCVVISGGIAACGAGAQNLVGPQFPGEVIVSERVITPANTKDPRSERGPLSDTTKQKFEQPREKEAREKEPREKEPRENIPLLALGNEVWERMLSLEPADDQP